MSIRALIAMILALLIATVLVVQAGLPGCGDVEAVRIAGMLVAGC